MLDPIPSAHGLTLGGLLVATRSRVVAVWRGAIGVLLAWSAVAVLLPWTKGPLGVGLAALGALLGLAACGAVLRIALTHTSADARAMGLGPAGFQLGRPELRLLGAGLLCAIFMAMVVAMLVLVLLAIFGLSELDPAAIRARDVSALGPLWKLAVMALVAAGVVVIPTMLATRLSLFAPATVARGRMVSLLVMRLSKGSVWPLFVALATLALPTLIALTLATVIGLDPTLAASIVAGVTVLIQAPLTLILLAVAYRWLDPDTAAIAALPGSMPTGMRSART